MRTRYFLPYSQWMTINTMSRAPTELHHGVLMKIGDDGVLIIGAAGIGKSSFALDLLTQDSILVADDCITFNKASSGRVIGRSPALLKNHLHHREIGLIDVRTVFGSSHVAVSVPLTVVVLLTDTPQQSSALHTITTPYTVLNQSFPQLTLQPQGVASLTLRLTTWLRNRPHTEKTLMKFSQQHQQKQH